MLRFVGYAPWVPGADSSSDHPAITRVLRQLADGEPGAADELLPLVYEQLRRIAQGRMAQLRSGQTLQATALVHEAWVRLGAREAVEWRDRAHFFGAAARAMRLILVDQARRKNADKRGGGQRHEALHDNHEDIQAPEPATGLDLTALDRALSRFESEHPRQAQLVMLRYFGGLPMAEIAELLDTSLRSTERDWLFARTWLRQAMQEED